ncbi:Ribosomal large subunit pseudouridine synthase D [Rosistilla carotiformis]|uniref:Ribosomal large subunit pseudouridine synthase D n=1 Tax=Rosistilla carotiformis TaxID=2528017 RepID=A0A518JQ27_9BACT|nr:RluA family pseudouridine synthase [Rosistilla carotiformis]QDV67645.1 Ribosomal large subunit pseudouridine synthase D [Rosistilla carotiformis]
MATRTLPNPSQPTGLLAHLIATLRDTKRTRVKEILRSGLVHVNGASVTQHATPVGPGDTVEIRDQRAVVNRVLPFDVLFEDASILVINKPNGMLTVGNKHEKKRTVEAIVNQSLAAQRQRCYIVQRLDLFTSGVLLLAKTEVAQKQIQTNWGASTKIYHALVEGFPKPPHATLTHFLKEDERLVVHASTAKTPDAIKATLSYETLNAGDAHTLLRVQLKTGKKNQIRAQMTAIGHPIAGDAKYGATTNPLGRLCLHASSLSIRHPKTQQRLSFEAPIPEGMDF